jgi:hypothetical protein
MYGVLDKRKQVHSSASTALSRFSGGALAAPPLAAMVDVVRCRLSTLNPHCHFPANCPFDGPKKCTAFQNQAFPSQLQRFLSAPSRQSICRRAHRRFQVRAQEREPGRKPKLSFGDQLLDYIEGGPKLRKWYGQEEQAPRDGGIEPDQVSLIY